MIKPLRDLILIKLDEREETSASGIFIKKAWEDAISTGEVLEVGPEVKLCKKGDRVMFNPYAYIDLAEKDVKIIPESDLLGHV